MRRQSFSPDQTDLPFPPGVSPIPTQAGLDGIPKQSRLHTDRPVVAPATARGAKDADPALRRDMIESFFDGSQPRTFDFGDDRHFQDPYDKSQYREVDIIYPLDGQDKDGPAIVRLNNGNLYFAWGTSGEQKLHRLSDEVTVKSLMGVWKNFIG